MEIRNKRQTLAGLFGRYVFVFFLGIVLAALLSFVMMFLVLIMPGSCFLPANYAEQELSRTKEQIQSADPVTEDLIPVGSLYGVYEQDGTYLYGNFEKKEQKTAWEKYKKENIYGTGKGYYAFLEQKSGQICIIKYFIVLRYANEKLEELLPDPEIFHSMLTFGLFLILTLLNGFFLSRKFAGKLKKQLACLSEATAKISANDLEFETEPSSIQEVDDVMVSLGKMKEALKDSLQKQWDTEQTKQQQLSALTHDIKTPLTVVRGNAELLAESELAEEERECAEEILKNTSFIENYLDSMRQVLRGQKEQDKTERIQVENLQKELTDLVCQLAAAKKIPVFVREEVLCKEPLFGQREREIFCRKKELLRAWGNLVSNGLEHTDREQGIQILFTVNGNYFVAAVRDCGAGFTEKALKYGTEPFFSGDESRHDRTHQGLGLSIAKEFMERQGGYLKYENVENPKGAEAALWILTQEKEKRRE